ncbi:MAG: YggS family pyridoxal phosphate-dependent enzyme [Candidatus Binatia bacterium]
MIDVFRNCRAVMDNIGAAAKRSGRDPGEIKLLAACKSHGVSIIRAAIEAGVRLLGENYVQEARPKVQALGEGLEWHLIGHLQRNKAREAVELFSVIESVDSAELARRLDREANRKGKICRTLIEVNLGGEKTKRGVSDQALPALLEEVGNLSNLQVEGLMLVPPFRADPQETRPFFRDLKKLQLKLEALKIPNVDLRELSMGMTHDYEVAVEEGATIVRIGTAIFGERRR